MRAIHFFTVMAVAALALAATPALAQDSKSKDTKVTTISIPVNKCAAPMGNIAIGDFDCKAASCGSAQADNPQAMFLAQALGQGGVQGVGKGLRNMLTTAIKESKCFKVIDLDQFKTMAEKLAATGQVVQPPKIDFFINGTITSIELSKSSGGVGGGVAVGSLFGPIGMVAGLVAGAVSKSDQKAKMGVDVSIMDPTTLEVTSSTAFMADSEKTSWGFGAGGIAGGVGGMGGFSLSENLALDNVAREVIIESANYVSTTLAGERIVERPGAAQTAATVSAPAAAAAASGAPSPMAPSNNPPAEDAQAQETASAPAAPTRE